MQQHVRISKYELRTGTFDEVAGAARAGISRVLEDRPGFVTHGVVDGGDRTILSLTLWETRRHADTAMPAAEAWVREHTAHLIDLRSTQSGELAFFEVFEGSPSTVEEPRATVQPALVSSTPSRVPPRRGSAERGGLGREGMRFGAASSSP